MPTPRYYTGIGSRSTPDEVLQKMHSIGKRLAQAGYTLRTGGARGADQAFEQGAASVNGPRIIYLPWSGFNKYVANVCSGDVEVGVGEGTNPMIIITGNDQDAAKMAATVHPAWDSLTLGAQKLHARNVTQVLGAGLCVASEFVVCWTPGGNAVGGTATAIRLAQRLGVGVYNLAVDGVESRLLASINLLGAV